MEDPGTSGRTPAPEVDFRAVFGSAPDAYLLLAPDPPRFTILGASETYLRATMTRREDVVGRPLFEVFPDNPTDPGATGVRNLQASLEEVIRTGEPHRMALQKYDIRAPDGDFEERFWDPLNSPVFDDRGKLVHLVHRVEDVTEQIRSGKRLRILESVVTTANDAVVVTEPEPRNGEGRRIIYVNEAFTRMTGYGPDEVIGRTARMLRGADTDPETTRRIGAALDRRESVRAELLNYRKDGSPFWVEVSISPVLDESGRVVQWTSVQRDTTERRRAEETALRLTREKAARAEEARAREEIESILEKLRESEERHRLLANMIPQHIWTTDPDGYHGYFSRRWYEFTGAAPEETEGEGWLRFLHPDDRERTLERWQHSLRTGEPYSIEYRFRRADGEYRWFLGQAMPLRDEAGEIVEWFGTLTDISDQKRAEDRLRESEERFRALGNSIPQLAWMAEPDGWIFWYNDRWHEYTGTTLEEMQGWGWQKVHHPDHVDRVVERIRHAFETGTPWEDTFPLRSRTGEYRWFLSRAVPIRDASGNVVRWFGTNTDVTEEREAAAERERLLEREREARADADRRREELERVTESRTRLMHGFTHDVKNPLGAADGYAELLEHGILGELSAKQVESVRGIRRSIEMSLHLIHELLELARAEAGEIELEPVPTGVGELAREAAEDFRAKAAAHGLGLEVRVPEALPTETDPARVRQILGNLLSNAVKYTPEGRITVGADLRTDGSGPGDGDWIAIRVSDTGPGIPEAKRETIFQEFTRIDPEAESGAGVGLAISRRIARLLGGDLTVESEVGRGSTFTLWLPQGES